MICNPDTLMAEAKCYRCIPAGALPSVMTYLMCQWANGGTPTPPPFTFVPTDIACLETWYKLETLEAVGYLDGEPIPTWAPAFGVKILTAYDPNAAGISPLYELSAGPQPGGPDVNLAPGGAFAYPNPPYPIEVFMIGFQQSADIGTGMARVLDCYSGVPFEVRYNFGVQIEMDLGVTSVSDANVGAIDLIWTTYDFCMAAANSYNQIGPNPNTLVPANPGANVPGGQLIIGNQVGWDPLTNADTKWGGSIADVLVFSCVLTTTQRNNLRTYFKNKYPGVV